MATQIDPRELDLQEQMSRIRQLIDASDRDRAQAARQRQEYRFAPVVLAISGATAGAALFAAGAAFAKLFFPG
ncbi:MAG: hypothetical protein LBV49_00020 [Azonexus sp.]|jgi:50S ribosomal subunit-associated GTPase HflX|nr:hypothetical protein [Azonexus sp.]